MGRMQRLAAKRPAELLEELEALAARVRAGESVVVPTVTLLLGGGHRLSGRFLSYRTAGRVGGAVTLDASETRARTDAAYAAIEDVVGLIVHHEGDTLAAFAGDAPAPPADAPGKLQLDRKLSELNVLLRALLGEERAVTVDWERLGKSPFAYAACQRGLDALGPALSRVAADELGRRSFLDRVAAVRVTAAPDGGVRLEARVLEVVLARDGDHVTAPGADAVARAIDALL